MNRRTALFLIASLICLTAPGHAQLSPYSQDVEGLNQTDPDALINDGWLIWGNLYDSGGVWKLGYGPFGAPNGGPAFSAVDSGQGGSNQGMQQLSIYSDYNCCLPDEGHFNGTDIVESLVFQEQTIGAGDIGSVWVLRFDAKRGNIDPEPGATSTATAFIRILDPGLGYALTYETTFDTTDLPVEWTEGNELPIVFDNPEAIGKILQVGFANRSSNFESTGVFYDNIVFEFDQLIGACGNSLLEAGEECDDGNTADGDGCSSVCLIEPGFTCTLPAPPNIVLDPSFEAGTPNADWTEASIAFGTPLCDVGTCGTGGGTGPADGDWWAWFGGVADEVETGSVEQSLVIPPGFDALQFQIEIPVSDTTGFLNVSIDGNVIASFTDADGAFVGYLPQALDVSTFADGNSHTLRFESTTDLGAGPLNFFVDDVRLVDLDAVGTPSVCTLLPICATPGLPIPDNEPGGASADVLPPDFGIITDLDVSIVTPHTWVGDLIYTLEHVDTTTSVVVIDRPGFVDTGLGCDSDNIAVILDDAAATAVEDQCGATPPAIGGTHSPNNPLAAFNGESLGGTWTLTVTDNVSGDTGTFEEWCLIPTTRVPDTDADGVADSGDNCTLVANADQRDTNGDGFGNVCDADVNNDCIINFLDLNLLKSVFFGADDDLDFNGDKSVNFIDLNIMKQAFFGLPGPSGIPNGC